MFALGVIVGAASAFGISGFFVFLTYRLAQVHAGEES